MQLALNLQECKLLDLGKPSETPWRMYARTNLENGVELGEGKGIGGSRLFQIRAEFTKAKRGEKTS
jgi:hypothetical protein